MMAIESSKNFEICQKKLCLPLRKDVHVYSICIGQRQEKKIQDYVQEKYIFLKILQMCGKPLHIMKLRMYYKDLIIISILVEGIFFCNFLALFCQENAQCTLTL